MKRETMGETLHREENASGYTFDDLETELLRKDSFS